METIRKPLQGIDNIIRFNWPFYLLSLLIFSLLMLFAFTAVNPIRFWLFFTCTCISGVTLLSIIISAYIYDFSGLYRMHWLTDMIDKEAATAVNVHAGFDETSEILQKKYHFRNLLVFDFYNSRNHTEPSIKRARKLYKPVTGTVKIATDHLPLANDTADVVFVMFAAHEIRNVEERIIFFKELQRIISSKGKIVVTEHLRDIPNFIVYTVGFFHFYSRNNWLKTFAAANLSVAATIKITPFIKTFILQKHGTAS